MKRVLVIAAALMMSATSFASSLENSSAISAELAGASVNASVKLSGELVQALESSAQGVSTIAGKVFAGTVASVKWSGEASGKALKATITVVSEAGTYVIELSVDGAKWSVEGVQKLFAAGKVVVLAGSEVTSKAAGKVFEFSKDAAGASIEAVKVSADGSVQVSATIVNASGQALIVTGQFLRGLVSGAR